MSGCHNISGNINETFIIEPLSITGGSPTLSACTALFTNEIISCSGNTHILMGTDTISFSGNLYSGGTDLYNVILSAITENDIYITGASFSGLTLVLNRRDGVDLFASFTASTFTGNTSGDCITDLYVSNIYGCSPITLHDDLIPNIDGTIDLGGELTVTDTNFTGTTATGLTTPWTSTFTGKRFRSINTLSGGSTVWTSTYRVNTPNLDLGLDSSGNTRIITADSSVIQDDLLFGGTF